jgi:hypothetical protein
MRDALLLRARTPYMAIQTQILNDPSAMSQARMRMDPYLKMIHTLLDGTHAMRRAAQTYLPVLPNESEHSYVARLERTTLLNILEDSIDNACSRLFDEPVKLEGNVPPELAEWAKNIDLDGSSLHEFAASAMQHAIADGMVHILVDYPTASPEIVGSNLGAQMAMMSRGQGQYGMASGLAPGNGLSLNKLHRQSIEGPPPVAPDYDANGNPIYEQGGYAANANEAPELADTPEGGDDPNDQGAMSNLPTMTLADEMALGMRPYLNLIPHTQIMAMYTDRVGGETIVTHVRILEEDVEREGFGERMVKRIRILEPGRWEMWVQDSIGGVGWVKQGEGELRKNQQELWDRVPIFTFRTGKEKGPFEVKPPFLDLAYANVKHWESSSLQDNILSQSRFPMLAVSGYEGQVETPIFDDDGDGAGQPRQMPFIIGPNTVLSTGDPGGKWYYVEPGGAAIEKGAAHLANLEKEMRVLGLEPLAPSGSTNTAMEAGINEAKARSPIEEWARGLEFKLSLAIAAMLRWVDLPGDPVVHFKAKVSAGGSGASEFMLLNQLRMTGTLSKLTILEEAKRRGILSPHFDPMEEMARLIIEGPSGDVAPYLGLPPTPPPMM